MEVNVHFGCSDLGNLGVRVLIFLFLLTAGAKRSRFRVYLRILDVLKGGMSRDLGMHQEHQPTVGVRLRDDFETVLPVNPRLPPFCL